MMGCSENDALMDGWERYQMMKLQHDVAYIPEHVTIGQPAYHPRLFSFDE
jgi:hypothetical protein